MNTVLRAVLDWRTVSPEELALWRAQLDVEKRARVEKMRKADDQTRSICADHLARLLLAQAGAGTETLRFSYSERGKPFCPGTGLHFSLSHSGFFAACVVADRETGIDIEQLRSLRPALARRVCTPEELTYLFPEGGFDSSRFLEVWTAKEAYLKYTGEGIATDLRRLSAADAQGLLPEICGRSLLRERTQESVLSIGI